MAKVESPFIDERMIGQGRVAIISAGVIEWKADFNVPRSEWLPATAEASPDGRLRLGTNFAFAQTDGARILIDPCVWDPQQVAGSSTIDIVDESPGLHQALVRLMVRPSDVSHVLITHAHLDHCSGVAAPGPNGHTSRFPNAVHILNHLEWEDVQRQPHSTIKDVLQPVADAGQLLLVDGAYDVGGGIRFLYAPGESPGHSIVELTSTSESFYYVGDLFHLPVEFVHTDWVPEGRDLQASVASRAWLIDRAVAADARVVFTHSAFPAWGRVQWTARPSANWIPDPTS